MRSAASATKGNSYKHVFNQSYIKPALASDSVQYIWWKQNNNYNYKQSKITEKLSYTNIVVTPLSFSKSTWHHNHNKHKNLVFASALHLHFNSIKISQNKFHDIHISYKIHIHKLQL
jgi:hypothetical protein